VSPELLLAVALLANPPSQVGSTTVVDSPSAGPVVGLLADVKIQAEVRGDVVAFLGDVRIAPEGVVNGDVVAVGGRVENLGRITGRTVGLGLAGRAQETTSARLRWGLRLVWMGFWLLAGWIVVLLFPKAVRACSTTLRRHGARLLPIGVLTLLVWTAVMLLAATAATATTSPVGVAVLLGGVTALLLAKAFGVVGLAYAVGAWFAPRLPFAWRGDVPATCVGLLALLVLATIPGLAGVVWLVVSLLGLALCVGALAAWRWPGADHDVAALDRSAVQ
jgi:hypothetical protein